MAKKMTKKRNSKSAASRMKRRQERVTTLLTVLFLLMCVGAFGLIRVINSDVSSVRPAQSWYVDGGGIEILAEPSAVTSDRGATGEGLPFLQPTATPVPASTRIPVPTPMPTEAPASGATALPEPTMPVLAPEPTIDASIVPITITAVGDCTLGGDIPSGAYRSFENYVRRYGYDYFFANVRSLFESDDLTIVNLEGPLTDSNDLRGGRSFNFRGEPEYVNILSGSSVEICNLANNHALDFGEAGFSETVSVLEEAGIGASGFSTVYFTEVKGVTVCSIGVTEWAYSQSQIEKMISLARPNCDLLIVSVHWGEERVYSFNRSQQKLGRAMIDAGADVVIGNHSHVYGGVELYNGKYIVYSLGNFCFGGNRNPNDKDCTIFQQTFNVSTDGTVTDGGISIIPASVSGHDDTNDFQPVVLGGKRADSILSGIAKVSEVDLEQVVWMKGGYQDELLKMAALANN